MEVQDKNVLMERVDLALDQVRPHLEVDGGNVEIVDITDDMKVIIKWLGNCQNCSMSNMTLKAGIEHTVRSVIPEITAVVDTND